jgi:DNA polymerase-3 subunit epsilon
VIESLPLTGAGGYPARGVDFTAVEIRTTGLRPGRVIELAAVRVHADGVVVGELATLVNPGPGVAPGPVVLHGITRDELDDAPSFGAVLGPLLNLCAGSVVVAHDLPFVTAFLGQEVARLGARLPVLPGVSTLAAARSAVQLPNYRLATVAGALGVPRPGWSAPAAARTVAQLATGLFGRHGFTFVTPPVLPALPTFAAGPLRPRDDVPADEPGWMADVVERVAAGRDDGDAYLDSLAEVVADQHLSPEEVAALAALAAEAGWSEDRVRSTHEQFVTALRAVAEGDGVVTAAEVRELRQVATALGVGDVVRDLRPSGGGKPTRVLVLGTSVAADRLRARVLAEGVQLAKKLTGSVTHLVADAAVPAHEPRLARAAELGAVVLDVRAAPVALGFERPPVERSVARTPVKLVGGRFLMGVGLVLMFIVVIAMFAGTPVAGGIVLAVFGVGALLGGWWLAEPGTR